MLSWDTLQVVIVLALVIVVFFGFVRERLSPDVVAMSAVAFLLAVQILSTKDVLAVFSNSAPITVGCMFVLSAALERTGVIDRMGHMMLRVRWPSPTASMAVVVLATMLLSAFVNNTPVVVILAPVVIALSRAVGSSPSRFLIPLSFASIFGGTCTLIGTSTNILADGVAQEHGLAAFGMFEITAPGLILGGIGVAYLALFARWLLPDRPGTAAEVQEPRQRQFLSEVLVPEGSSVIGKRPSETGLGANPGIRVIEIIRDGISLNPEYGEPVLCAGDRLVIHSRAADVLGLRSGKTVQFSPEEKRSLEPISSRETKVMEGIVGPDSAFVGRRIGDLNLSRIYGVYVLAVHRHSVMLSTDYAGLRLAFGDTLLLEGPADGLRRLFDHRMLVSLSEPVERPFRRNKAPIAIVTVLAMMALAGIGQMPIAALAMIAATAVIAFGCLDAEEAYKAIHWRILILIFAMLALGTAMEKTGAVSLVVDEIMRLVADLGPVAVLSVVYLLTSLVTEVMSNNAAAILLTPIAIELAEQLGVDARPFVVAVMFAASASFATPFGYQTNAFVYGAGGYRFVDFLRIGVPLNLIMWFAASLVIPLFWPLQ